MAPDAAPPSTRRAMRSSATPARTGVPAEAAQAASPESREHVVTATLERGRDEEPPHPSPDASPTPPRARWGPTSSALIWVDETSLAAVPRDTDLDESTTPELLPRKLWRSPWRPGVLLPAGLLITLIAVYVLGALLWPLHAVAPRVDAAVVQPVAAPVAAPAWPEEGSAAVSVAGTGDALASSADVLSIASITKVVTALLVLEAMPLSLGETGPEYWFTAADSNAYWQYRSRGESALDVPVGGSLTQYQMLEGTLLGSANNYADRLASEIWPSDAVFADAAADWLSRHGIAGVTIVDPTGIEAGNRASAGALLALAAKAMENPVIAEIVGKPGTDLPGAGFVENRNPLIADPGVVGIKTGTLDTWNLLSAKDLPIGDTTVRVYAAVLGQPGPEERDAASRALLAQVEQELQLEPAVTEGTLAGRVLTRWAEPVDVLVAEDASVVLWNGGTAGVISEFALDEQREAGESVGRMIVTGPLSEDVVELELASDVEGPSAWWRLTHPLELLGLD